MGWFTRGWALTKTSWRVLMADKELLTYTVLSAVCTLVAAAALALPGAVLLAAGGNNGVLAVALLFCFYLVLSFITIFFNSALTGAVLVRLRGGDPDVAAGFGAARGHLGAIAGYAVISATVGVVLHLLEEKFKLLGQLAASLLGGAWGLVTFLVVPFFIAEDCSPFEAIKRSTVLLKRTFGEQISGSLSIGGIMFLLALPAALPVVLGALSGSTAALIVGVVIAALYLGLVFLVGSTLNQIFRAAVYVYADTGTVPAQFDRWMVQDAFKAKSGE